MIGSGPHDGDDEPTLPNATTESMPVPSPWSPGTRFSTYELESRLAVGGMAEVWRAKIKGLEGFEKRIVIKTMLPHLQQRPELVDRFVGEASVAARLSHPNIVDVLDFGQLEGRYFIAMEYVSGLTLRLALRRALDGGRRLPIGMVLHVLSDVCEALQHMHELADSYGELGLIHRDLSPEDIVISTSGATKLIDFGAARATARTEAGPPFIGKYRYAAPERIRNEGEDSRSDVYSAGVVLYECLVGRRPFEGTDAEVIGAATSAAFCDPLAVEPDMAPSLAAVVRKATAQRPSDRFTSARELGAALGACLSELGASSKERDVTAALSELMEAEASPSRASGRSETEAVPEVIGMSFSSGPLPPPAPGAGDETRRVNLPVPPEAFAPRAGDGAGPAKLS